LVVLRVGLDKANRLIVSLDHSLYSRPAVGEPKYRLALIEYGVLLIDAMRAVQLVFRNFEVCRVVLYLKNVSGSVKFERSFLEPEQLPMYDGDRRKPQIIKPLIQERSKEFGFHCRSDLSMFILVDGA